MKTIKLIFTATVVAIAAIATAVERPKMSVEPLTVNRAVISITNERSTFFELSINSETGDLVYYKRSTKPLNSYQKIFDFKELQHGDYVLTLKVNDTKLSKSLEVSRQGISVGKSELRVDPYFDFKNGVLKFSYLNFDKESFRMSIYSQEELVFKEKIGEDFSISKGYDLSKLKTGNYEVVLSSYENEFVYSLVK